MRLDDRLVGAAIALLGGVYTVEASGLPTVAGQAYGAGFFPTILGVLMTLSGLALAARGFFVTAPAHGEPATHGPLWLAVLRFLALIAAILFYWRYADTLGFALTSVLIMVSLAILLGARPILIATVPIAATAVLMIVFGNLLRVPLPIGPLDVF